MNVRRKGLLYQKTVFSVCHLLLKLDGVCFAFAFIFISHIFRLLCVYLVPVFALFSNSYCQ